MFYCSRGKYTPRSRPKSLSDRPQWTQATHGSSKLRQLNPTPDTVGLPSTRHSTDTSHRRYRNTSESETDTNESVLTNPGNYFQIRVAFRSLKSLLFC